MLHACGACRQCVRQSRLATPPEVTALGEERNKRRAAFDAFLDTLPQQPPTQTVRLALSRTRVEPPVSLGQLAALPEATKATKLDQLPVHEDVKDTLFEWSMEWVQCSLFLRLGFAPLTQTTKELPNGLC